jgi:hypothetical protein
VTDEAALWAAAASGALAPIAGLAAVFIVRKRRAMRGRMYFSWRASERSSLQQPSNEPPPFPKDKDDPDVSP